MAKIRPRKHDRVIHLREVTLRAASGGPSLRGHTIDLSPSGVRVFTDAALAVGEPVDLTWADTEPRVTLRGWVVYAKIDVEGTSGGVAFHPPLGPNEFQKLRTS
jgi:hypothetical protein